MDIGIKYACLLRSYKVPFKCFLKLPLELEEAKILQKNVSVLY